MNFAILILIAIAAIAIFLVMKFKETRHKMGFVILFVLLLFFGLSIWKLYSSNNLDLTSYDGLIDAGRVYFSWLGSVFHNAVKISSYTTKLDWSINSTENSGVT